MSDSFRILFIGNSYTSRHDLPSLVAALAGAAGVARPLETALVAFGGASLAAHWNRDAAQQMLSGQRWDAVVLQDQSTRALRAPGSLREYGRRFVEAAQAERAKAFLYMPWARAGVADAADVQAEIARVHEDLGRETGAAVVPVGLAWQRLSATEAAPALYDADGSHPTFAGSYLAACVFCATLFGVLPQVERMTVALTHAQLALLHRAAGARALRES